jgi:two-component system sensor histidine kinase/response regulator
MDVPKLWAGKPTSMLRQALTILIDCAGIYFMSDSSNNVKNPALSILVVDDDELNQRMMRLLLKRDGHSVECVSNGLEAYNAITTQSFDMVLMDLQMPVMDGVEASRRIRAWEGDNTHIFIVALTASYLPERGRELFEAGIDNYMAKPFDVDHLRHILQYGIENRKAQEVGDKQPETAVISDEQEFDYQLGIQRVGGDRETYNELFKDFVDELPEKLENMRSCYYIKKDMDGLYRAAHNLKGVSANLGALQLSEHAGRLEKQVSESYTEQIESILNDISIASDRLKESSLKFFIGNEAKAS